MMFRLNLITRISAIVFVTLVAIWLIIIGILFSSHERIEKFGRPTAAQIAALVELIERTEAETRPLVLAAANSAILDARISSVALGDEGPSRKVVDPDHIAETYSSALKGRPVTVIGPLDGGHWRWLPWTARHGLELRIPLSSGDALILNYRAAAFVTSRGYPVGFWAGIVGTLVALVALISMHWQMRPLVRLVHAVDHIDLTGSNVVPMRIRTGAPEIKSLIEAFERLQARVAQLIRGRVALLGGISHDARTFATRLRLAVDSMEDCAERDRAIVDIADMIRLLDDALLASRSIADELTVELFEVGDLVRSEIGQQLAENGKVGLHVSPDVADIAILGDRLALRRVISNLVENALKYGHAAHVSVSRLNSTTISLIVDDEGRGIPAEMRDTLFEPFVRLENSRSRHTGGAGLGLAVVRNLVEAHRGTILVGDAPRGGARFTVNLPIFATPVGT